MYEESNVDQTSNKDRITVYSNQNFDFGGAMSTGGIPTKVQQESPAIKTGPTVSQLQGMAQRQSSVTNVTSNPFAKPPIATRIEAP